MAKQFENPYAKAAASSSRKAQPKRPVYDFEDDAKAKSRRQSGRISYGAGEIIPPPVPKPAQVPRAPQRQAAAPPPKRTQPIRAAKGAPYDTAKDIEPIAAVTPQGRAQRKPPPQMHGHLHKVPTGGGRVDRPLGQTVQRGKRQGSAENKKQVRFPVRKKPASPVAATVAQARSSATSISRKPAREISYKDIRRRQFRRSLMLVFGVVIALLIGFVLSVTVLFKIETIAVEFTGESPYTKEQVLTLLDFQQGDNLFTFRAEKTAQRLAQNLPYLEAVTIQRRLPGTVNVVAQPAVERYEVNSDFGWAVLSTNLKVLRIEVEQPGGLIALFGVQASVPVVGAEVAFTEEATQPKANLQTVITALQAQGIENITEINLSSDLELSFLYEGRVRVLLGTTNELTEKIEWAKDVIVESGKITPEEKGTLDVSSRYKDGQLAANWRPGRI